jgi:transposase
MHKRRKYSQEYKQEAVQLVRQSDIPLAQVAKNLGINPNILRRWGTEISSAGKNAFPGNGTPRDLELALLKRELQQVKQERDFLKEAAAYFAKTSK